VWTTAADFKRDHPGCELSIKTSEKPFSTGRTKYIIGLHRQSAQSPAIAEHTAMKLGDAGSQRLTICREAMEARQPDAPTDLGLFVNLD
jgi:hypothetical protein